MKNLKKLATVAMVSLIFLLCSGCADSVTFNSAATIEPVGFWYGLWHGMILPFAWFVSLFSDSTAIYAIYNSGGWYDFGFAMGVGALSSSSGTATVRRRRR